MRGREREEMQHRSRDTKKEKPMGKRRQCLQKTFRERLSEVKHYLMHVTIKYQSEIQLGKNVKD